VHTSDGRVLQGRVDEPKGDPGNTLSREEITAKALRLAAHSGGASEAEMHGTIERLWNVARAPSVGMLLVEASS
jgi:2-methylcitrate dehydratase PrpD